MNDPIDKILARVKAFVHFRDLHPDESYTSPEARDAIALAAEVEALRKDAERYRWLRDEQPNECCCSWSKHLMDVPNTEFDAAIDAAMEGSHE
jgi:hypothetical protein